MITFHFSKLAICSLVLIAHFRGHRVMLCFSVYDTGLAFYDLDFPYVYR